MAKKLISILLAAGAVLGGNASGGLVDSPKNPFWIGEKTAATLQFGEWTMDIDVAMEKVMSFNGRSAGDRAYALVLVEGYLWCPDCVMADRWFFSYETNGVIPFKEWARSRNVALSVVDIPNYSMEGYRYGSLLTADTFMTADSYVTGYGTWAADESLRYQSGAEYLSVHGISSEAAAAVIERNRCLVQSDTLHGGFRRPESPNSYRVGVPTLILLRDDGTVAGRFDAFSWSGPSAYSENFLVRLDELLRQADEEAEEANDDWRTTSESICVGDDSGIAGRTLSHTDLRDVYMITNVIVGQLVTFQLSSSSSREVTLSMRSVSNDNVPIATVTGFANDGLSVTGRVPDEACYLVVSVPRSPADQNGSSVLTYSVVGGKVDEPKDEPKEKGTVTFTFGKKWYEALADDEGVTCVGWKNFYMGANVAIPVTVTDADGESVVLTADDITVKPGTYIDYGTPYVLSEAEMWETYGRPLFDVRNSGWRIDLEKDGGVWVYNNWDWEDEADFTYELEKGIWPFFDDDYSDDSDVDIWLDAHGDRQWIVIPTGTRPQKGTHTFTVQVSIGGNSAKCPVSFIMSPDQKAKAATVRFNANGGMVSEYGRVANLNAAIGTLPVPEARRGYTFKGWFTAKTKGAKITAATKVTKAMTLYAQWTAKKYKVYVEAEGGKVVGAGWHATGSKVKLTMIPGKNRKFGSWGLYFLDFNGNGQWDEEWSESVWDDGEGYYISDAEKSIWEKCKKSMSTMWNPTLTFTMPPCDVYLGTIAWTKKEEKAHGLFSPCAIPNPWYVADGGEAEVWFEVYTLASFSANKTIPAGMKLVRESDYGYILKVVDASKLPAGVKKVKFTVTTRWGYKVTETLTVILPNKTQAVDAGTLALEHLDSHDYYTLKAGVKNQWNALGIQALGGWTLSSVTGIPGLTWDAKNKKMKGVPSKAGLYTATFTVTKGKAKKVATANFKIEALPANVVGTFHGYTMKPVDSCCEDDSPLLGKKSRKVTVTSGSDGKITAKIGSDTIALTGWTLEDGLYKVRYMKNVEKKDKKYTGITKTEFEVAIDQGAAWDEDAVTGTFYYYDGWSIPNCISCNTPAKYTKSTLRDEVFCARKNAAATSGDAKTIAAEYAKLGKQSFIVHKAPSGSGYAYDLWCPNCIAFAETYKKTLFAKIEPNGKVTLSGTIAGTKVSGVTYLAYEHRRHWYYDEWEDEWDFYEAFEVVARFFVGQFVIEISGPADKSLDYFGTLEGYVWKK